MLHVLTVISIFWLGPSHAHAQKLCGEVFAGAETPVQASIQNQLVSLRETLAELRQELKKTSDLEPNRLSALEKLSEDPREISYVLQGAYRLLLDHPEVSRLFRDKEVRELEKGLKMAKKIEKILGTYQVEVDEYRLAKKLHVPADFLAFLKAKRDRVSDETMRILKKEDFLNKDITAVSKHLAKIDVWENKLGPNTKKYIEQSLRVQLERVRTKVNTEIKPLIMAKKYTAHELEDGAHAFRRSLRWLRVFIDAYADHLTPNPQEYAVLDQSIEILRKIKKPGEMREKMAAALADFGYWGGERVYMTEAYNKIDALMEKKFDNIEIRTQEVLKTYEKHNGFAQILQEAP